MSFLTYQKDIYIENTVAKLFKLDKSTIDILLNTCYKIKKVNPKKEKCNLTGWRSSWFTHTENEELANFSNELCVSVKEQNIYIEAKHSWFGIYEIGDMAKEHNHGDFAFTGIVYLEIGNRQSPLVFENIALFFEPGDFILFKGQLLHYVPRTCERRIILAYNFESSL